MKKVLSLALAALIASSMSVSAFAALPTGGQYESDIDVADFVNEYILFHHSELELSGFATDDKGTPVKHSGDNIKSEQDFYVTHPVLAKNYAFADNDLFKVSFKKTENGDRIRYALIQEKELKETDGRVVAFRFILMDLLNDDEFKVEGTATFTARTDMAIVQKHDVINIADMLKTDNFEVVEADERFCASADAAKPNTRILEKGTKIKIPVQFFVKNNTVTGDYDAAAGEKGFVIKPSKNDDNEVTWEDETKTLASLKFASNDDPNVFYPKMSTKWHSVAPYTPIFADQDAYIFNFMGNPSIASTSRPVLSIYNPFVDEEDENTVDPEDVIIFGVVGGELKDVTSNFKVETNDDGDSVFTCRDRQLGTYIFTDKIPDALIQAAAAKAAAAEKDSVPAAKLTPAKEAVIEATKLTPAKKLVLPSSAK